jgi:dihydroorotate dehydrogenase electron transfer subunit
LPFKPVAAPVEAWMVAGGVGLAPFATLAESLAASRTPSTLFYGARTAEELFYVDFFEQLGIKLVLATEDGARGTRGRVTVPLEAALKNAGPTSLGNAAAMVYACGPEPMLEAVARLAARYNQPSQVSVERVMGCGLGGCYSCVVPVKHGDEHANLVRSCISGPVFDGGRLFHDKGCLNCHLIHGDGGRRGPELTYIADKLTRDNLVIRILNGGTNMPAYGPSLKPGELDALVAFLETRKRPLPP